MAFNFKLISLKKSLNGLPEHSAEEEIHDLLRENRNNWANEQELDQPEDGLHEVPPQKLGQNMEDMELIDFSGKKHQYIKKDCKIIGFDESSKTCSGTYSKLSVYKFGEGQIAYKNDKYDKDLTMFEPMIAYIEDDDHKLKIYKSIIKNFIATIKDNFYVNPLQGSIDQLEKWYKSKFKKELEERIGNSDFRRPSIKHIINRIRTSDEILKSLIRIRDISNWGKKKNCIFLGDGIHMFQHFEFPPQKFTEFFNKFIKEFDIKYYSFSKECKLRDKKGKFIVLYWKKRIKSRAFLIKLPKNLHFSNSQTFIVRLVEGGPVLRFDLPEFYSLSDAISILKNLIPYSPYGYPLALSGAHKASTLLPSEQRKVDGKFLNLQYQKSTKNKAKVSREGVLPY
ncbi:MAG: hypothetical protein R6U96_05830 [Promethearchaeia archaeon]